MHNDKCIDFHSHPVTDAFRSAMDYLGIDVLEDDGFPLPNWSPEVHLSFMEQAGIDYSILSIPTPHIHHGDDEKAKIAARRINESVADICKLYPDRFGLAACVPLPYVEGAIQEAKYAFDELGAVAIKLSTNSNGVYLGDPSFAPFMELLNQKKALIIIHPCRAQARPENCITGTVAAIYEYPIDTTRAVLNMISHQIMTKYPDIRWIIPHCGSFLPYMLQRFAGVSGILANMGMMDPVDIHGEFEKLFFDIAGDPEPFQLNMLRMVCDDSHIVYGSDFPHSPAPVILNKKKHFDKNEEFDNIREKIYFENGKELIKGL